MSANIATMAYIAATILFILSLGGLSNPETSRRGNLYGIVGMAHRRARDRVRPARHRGRHSVDRRCAAGRRLHRPVRGEESADDADAGAGRAHAQPRRPRGLPRRLRELRRHLDRLRRRREGHPRSRDLHRHPDRCGDVLGLGHRLRQAVRQDRRQADAAARAPLAQPRRPARRDLVRRAVPAARTTSRRA